jgi:hypothetical protein
MIWTLRLVLILLWIPAQYLGVLLGALGSLAAQSKYSNPGSVLIGVLGLVAPAVLTLGGLYLSWRRPDLGAKALTIPIGLLAAELALLLLFAWSAGR